MPKIIKDWLTESDGASYCPWNLIGIVASGGATYKFVIATPFDSSFFVQFGLCIAAIIGAIIGKRVSERGEGDPK
jgi:hypothetical protein